jgi:methylglutaconyl-CoA hydratase
MSREDILPRRVDERGVATLTLNRPEVHNAFNDELVAAIDESLAALAEDDAVRMVVLTGAGKHFCAGGDLKWMARLAMASDEDNDRDARAVGAMMRRLKFFPKPTLAVVRGAAMGGGASLVVCCDIAVAAADARFSVSGVKMGVLPVVISPYIVSAIGPRRARRYYLTGEAIPADEAKAIGLIHEVAAPEALDQAAETLIGHLLDGSPAAQRMAKELVAMKADPPAEGAEFDRLAAMLASLRSHPEALEGMAAFLEKRPPSWRK